MRASLMFNLCDGIQVRLTRIVILVYHALDLRRHHELADDYDAEMRTERI